MRQAVAVIAAVAVATFLLASPSPVRAECPYVVIPPATKAAPSAREVIVGTVIENVHGQLFDFRLRVDHVLEGNARVGDVRRFNFLYPNWPPAREGDGTLVRTPSGKPFMPCEAIPGWEGNVMVLALEALAPDGRTRYNAASWISGRMPINRHRPKTTLAEITRLAALPATDAIAAGMPAPRRADQTGPLLLWSGLGIGAALSWRRRRRSSPSWHVEV
jgi:hypothetical protein